ncbi:MAG TPA: DUF962 domain-containing protein [Micropepsaceae bacterium]|nr:DUF962 domain-containing protein [Micropepsaceae bacterium]
MAQTPRIQTYREFWPYYLREHAHPETRLWHIVGTGTASVLFVAAIVSFSYELLLGALATGYGPAWIAHLKIEKNRPATWRYPIWSLLSDFRMAGAWLTGALEHELREAGIPGEETFPG